MAIPTLITDICTAIVGPHFRLGVHEGSETWLLEIFAGPGDIGELIGRDGQLARALQEVAMVAGCRNRH